MSWLLSDSNMYIIYFIYYVYVHLRWNIMQTVNAWFFVQNTNRQVFVKNSTYMEISFLDSWQSEAEALSVPQVLKTGWE